MNVNEIIPLQDVLGVGIGAGVAQP